MGRKRPIEETKISSLAKVNHHLNKYYSQRYQLFSRFDQGIQLDEESWYSVTPEKIAIHHADKYHKLLKGRHSVILDGFCGAGGNLIQFARRSELITVIGCDIDLQKIKFAKNNAKVYGVENQCEFIVGDFRDMVKSFKDSRVDAVFLSPPWGGVDYLSTQNYSLSAMKPNGFNLIDLCRKHLSPNIGFLLPRNVDADELISKVLCREYPELEFESNCVGKKVKTITIYLGNLVSSDEVKEKKDKNDS